MGKSFAIVSIPAVTVVLMALVGLLVAACSSDAPTSQTTWEDVQTEQSAKNAQIEQPTRDSQAGQPTKLETLTVDDVKSIVVETAMSLYQDGLMSEPREIHAEEACKLWDVHGTSKPANYWGDKMTEAEDMNMSSVMPVLVIMRTLVALNERYETSEPAIAQYCDNILRTESKPNADADIDLSHLPQPNVQNMSLYEGGGYRCPPGAENNVLRALECQASFPKLVASVEIEIEGDASKVEQYVSVGIYSEEIIAISCSPELIPQRFDGWDNRVLSHWRNKAEDARVKGAFDVRIDMVNALGAGHINNSDIRLYCANAISK